MNIRVLALLLVVAGSWAPGLSLVAPAAAASPPPAALDCAAMPCAEVMPAAAHFRPVDGAPHWEGLDEDGDVVGWLALSTDLVDLKAYSGKPLVTVVGLDADGTAMTDLEDFQAMLRASFEELSEAVAGYSPEA